MQREQLNSHIKRNLRSRFVMLYRFSSIDFRFKIISIFSSLFMRSFNDSKAL